MPASSCTYKSFQHFTRIMEDRWQLGRDECKHHEAGHLLLSPFFVDNKGLQDLYKYKLADVPSSLEGLVKSHQQKYILPTVGCGYSENTWTHRLFEVLQTSLVQKYTIKYSAPGGPNFPALQYERCGLSAEYINVYPFRGMPDISVSKSIYVETEKKDGNDSDDDPDFSFEDCIFENTKKMSSLAEVPPKFGQLFATLHCYLVQRVLKHIIKGEAVQSYPLEAISFPY